MIKKIFILITLIFIFSNFILAAEPSPVETSSVSKPSTPQGESVNELIVPADGKEPIIPEITEGAGGEITQETVKKSGGVNIEAKIIQLEQKINYLIYFNVVLFLFIVAVLLVVIIKIKKKNFPNLDI